MLDQVHNSLFTLLQNDSGFLANSGVPLSTAGVQAVREQEVFEMSLCDGLLSGGG